MADLFDRKYVYPNRPGSAARDTSIAAARDFKPKQGTVQAQVLLALRNRPMASFELVTATGRVYASVQPRTSELAIAAETDVGPRGALIRDSGIRRPDPSSSKLCVVWCLTDEGIAVAQRLSADPRAPSNPEPPPVPSEKLVDELARCLGGFTRNRREFALAPTAHEGFAGPMGRLFDKAEDLVSRWEKGER